MIVNEKSGLEYMCDTSIALSPGDIYFWHTSSFLLFIRILFEKINKASMKNKCLIEETSFQRNSKPYVKIALLLLYNSLALFKKRNKEQTFYKIKS